MRTALAVRHLAFEDLGLLGPLLAARGYTVVYVDAWALDPGRAHAADLVVFLGGPISVNDHVDYPFIALEVEIAQHRLSANQPTLGICLGAQVLAQALGGSVGPGPTREIGWAPLALTDAGRTSALAELEGVAVLHWHGECCELPAHVPSLAHTELCATQAFEPAARALALQFHAEAGSAGLEPWLVGHTAEIAVTPGVSVQQLRADTARLGPGLREPGRRMFERWLESVEA